jgi:hypothetical protein
MNCECNFNNQFYKRLDGIIANTGRDTLHLSFGIVSLLFCSTQTSFQYSRCDLNNCFFHKHVVAVEFILDDLQDCVNTYEVKTVTTLEIT